MNQKLRKIWRKKNSNSLKPHSQHSKQDQSKGINYMSTHNLNCKYRLRFRIVSEENEQSKVTAKGNINPDYVTIILKK